MVPIEQPHGTVRSDRGEDVLPASKCDVVHLFVVRDELGLGLHFLCTVPRKPGRWSEAGSSASLGRAAACTRLASGWQGAEGAWVLRVRGFVEGACSEVAWVL